MALLSRFVWIMASRVIAALLQAVTLIIVAREAGPLIFGVLASFMGVVIIIQVGSDCGIATYITRLRATNPDSQYIALALKVHQRLGIIACVTLLFVAIVTAVVTAQAWWLLVLLAFAGYLERQSAVRLAIAMADGDVWKNAVNLTARRSITFLVVGLGTVLSIDIVLVFGIGSFFGALLSLWLSKRLVTGHAYNGSIGANEFRDVFSVSRAFWMNSIGVQLRNFDVLLVAALGAPVIAGYYGAIARSINPLTMISSSLAAVLLPAVARVEGKMGRSMLVAIGLIVGAFSSLYFGLAVYADTVVDVLLGPVYAPASDGFRIALVGLIFASCSALLSSFLQARGFEKSVGRVSILTSLLSLSSISVGVIFYGVTGAVLGLVTAYLVQVVFLLSLALKSGKRAVLAE